MEWAKLTSVSSTYEADLLAGRLEDAGIGSRTAKGAGAPGAWLTGSVNPFGPVDVYVSAVDVDAARKLLPTPIASEDSSAADSPRGSIHLVGTVLVVVVVVTVIAAVLADVLNGIL